MAKRKHHEVQTPELAQNTKKQSSIAYKEPSSRRDRREAKLWVGKAAHEAPERILSGPEAEEWLRSGKGIRPGSAQALLDVFAETVGYLDGKPITPGRLYNIPISKDDFVPAAKRTYDLLDCDYLTAYLDELKDNLAHRKRDARHYAQLAMVGGYPIRELASEIEKVERVLKQIAEPTVELRNIVRSRGSTARVYVVDILHDSPTPSSMPYALLTIPDCLGKSFPSTNIGKADVHEVDEAVKDGKAGEDENAGADDGPFACLNAGGSDAAKAETAVGSDFAAGEGDDEFDPDEEAKTILNGA